MNGECNFYIGNSIVCPTAWRFTLGIAESTFYNIKKQVAGKIYIILLNAIRKK